MKKFSIFMLAALALVACNKEQNAVVDQLEADQTPVSFGAYVSRPTTKAGYNNSNLELGNWNNVGLRYNVPGDKGRVGFGVFAYYTNADNYDQSFTPNFMYNQHLLYVPNDAQNPLSTGTWNYSPIKYWPNEFGINAQSDDADKISFFAYAPYVTVNPTSGKVKKDPQLLNTGAPVTMNDDGDATYGIVGMKRNNAAGDPMIQYIVTPFTNKQVDLLWGLAGRVDNSDATHDTEWEKKNGGTAQTFSFGMPYLNVEHPYGTSSTNLEQRVAFNFHHALAQLVVTVDTKTNSTSTENPHDSTKVFIRSVTFEGFETKAALNLNNSIPSEALWYNFDCGNELNNGSEFTIYDGRKDGKEGITAATKEYAAINPKLIQSSVWKAKFGQGETDPTPGVKKDPVNLFCQRNAAGVLSSPDNNDDPILVIPNGDRLKVTIEYDVLTSDPNLAGLLNDGVTPGSVVKNVITRYITQGAGTNGWGSITDPDPNASPAPDPAGIVLANGKKYVISLHLGLNSVEFDANIMAWGVGETGGADLPHNNPQQP